MTERLTSSQIQSHLEHEIALHPGCRNFLVKVNVRRLEHDVVGRADDWAADFYAVGDLVGRDACEEALEEILDHAREDYSLSLDS